MQWRYNLFSRACVSVDQKKSANFALCITNQTKIDTSSVKAWQKYHRVRMSNKIFAQIIWESAQWTEAYKFKGSSFSKSVKPRRVQVLYFQSPRGSVRLQLAHKPWLGFASEALILLVWEAKLSSVAFWEVNCAASKRIELGDKLWREGEKSFVLVEYVDIET